MRNRRERENYIDLHMAQTLVSLDDKLTQDQWDQLPGEIVTVPSYEQQTTISNIIKPTRP